MIHLALYHPQIPQNTGTLLRLSACLGFHLDLIHPFGFIFDDKKLKRAGMDYITLAKFSIHKSFEEFLNFYKSRRIIAIEANVSENFHNNFKYEKHDILIAGSEHSGFNLEDSNKIPIKIKIPMQKNCRSINLALASTIVVSEAFSQLNLFPKE